MVSTYDLKKLSFLVYGLGMTGISVVNFFKKHKIKNYKVWDDKKKHLFKNKKTSNLSRSLEEADFIVLSPGVSLIKSINKNRLIKYKHKIITDIDLIFLLKRFVKSIVVTGTNGKSTTCKILSHVLKKNKYNTLLGGNIGIPILNQKISKKTILIIEASSYQLAHSKFITPDYAFLLNISNDHLDWHGSKKKYINCKFKIFKHQKNNQFSFINNDLEKEYRQRNFSGRLVIPNIKSYKRLKPKIKNSYLRSTINDQNMSYVLALTKLFNISEKSFLRSLTTFVGLPHRYEIFLKRKNCVFINDSKATTFEASKFALKNSKDIYWIVGGLPKKGDSFILKNIKKNIIKSYIIGKNTIFFKNQIRKHVDYFIANNLKNAIIKVLKDIRSFKKKHNLILFSPASASFDQYLNFERRGDEFKKLSKLYARKYI